MSDTTTMTKKTSAAARKRKPLVRPSKIDAKAYNEVVASARLADLRLISSRSEVKPEALEGDRSGWELKAGDELVDWKFEDDKGRLWARISFKAECIDGRRKQIVVEGDYLVVYHVEGEVDAASANLFVARVARFACYPYFRTLFATLLGQSNIVLPPLPVLKEVPRRITPQKTTSSGTAKKPAVKPSKKVAKRPSRVRAQS